MKRISFLVLLLSGSMVFAGLGPHAFPKLARYERLIAIDDACGWPQVTLMPDGSLACLIWPVPAYYSRGIPSHQRSPVGVVRWMLPTADLKVTSP